MNNENIEENNTDQSVDNNPEVIDGDLGEKMAEMIGKDVRELIGLRWEKLVTMLHFADGGEIKVNIPVTIETSGDGYDYKLKLKSVSKQEIEDEVERHVSNSQQELEFEKEEGSAVISYADEKGEDEAQ